MNKYEIRLCIKNFDIIAKNRLGPFHIVLKSTISNLYMRLFPDVMVSNWEEAFMYEHSLEMLNVRISTLSRNNLKIVLITRAGDINLQPGDINA